MNEIDERSEVPNEEKFVMELLKYLENNFPDVLFATDQDLTVPDGTHSLKYSLSWSVRENEFPKKETEELAEKFREYMAMNNTGKNHTTYNLRYLSHSKENNGKIYVAIEISVHTQE